MNTLFKKVEFVANVAIIAVAILLTVVLLRNYVLRRPAAPLTAAASGIQIGTKLSLPNFDWSTNRQTLVMALSTECHFCTESMPFYRTLVAAAPNKTIKLVAVFPQEQSVAREYLKKMNVQIDDVRQLPLDSVNVRGTPTLILVNGGGEVIKSWVGKLPDTGEKELLSAL
jgi:thiol-disulfide isomerase/thioredoxin